MVASIFIVQGYDTFRRPERVAPLAEPVVRPLAERVPAMPANAEQAVRINGAVQMAAGALLALGRFPRLSALAMAGTLVPTTLAGHRFWEVDEEGDQAQQRIHFLKNLLDVRRPADRRGGHRREPVAGLAHQARRQDGAPRSVPGRPDGQGDGEGLGEGRPPGRAALAQVVRV